jgi:2-polyprenyl-6-methoxyphenol hydroxylase-like FAD-dependent oxidoreductase
MTSPRIIVIGGGIGGLCLAQGLRRVGIDVAVYERDTTPAARSQGYRLNIEPVGSRALRGTARGFFRTCGAIDPLRRAVFSD